MRRKSTVLGIVVLVTLFAVSCGGGSGPTNKGVVTQSQGLLLDSSSLSFGNVSVGSSKSAPMSLTNSSTSGGPSISVSQIVPSGAGYSVSTPMMPLILPAGKSATITVTFAPQTGGTSNGTLTLTVMGESQPITAPMSGAGLLPGQLSANPTSMNLGNVDLGKSQQQGGMLTAGGTDVNVSSASWNGQGYSLSGITFPTTIKAGTSTPFIVTFDPQASGSAPGQVSFLSDATNSPTVVTLNGSGVQHTVSLSWGASTSQVSGYNIYRATTSGGPFTMLNTSLISGLSFTDTNPPGGATYYYAATAVDSSNNESPYSNIATAVIP